MIFSIFTRIRFAGPRILLAAAIMSCFSVDAAAWQQGANAEDHALAYSHSRSESSAKQSRSWYGSLHIGGVFFPGMKFEGTGTDIEIPSDVRYGVGAAFGYRFWLGLRVETEFSYRAAEANSVEISTFGTWLDGSGGVDTVNVMANAWFDFDFLSFLFGNWSPYVGGGLGIAKFWVDPGYWTLGGCGCSGSPWVAVPVLEASDTAYVWQLGGGLTYRYSEALHISLDYRWLRSLETLEFDDPANSASPFKADYASHSLFAVFRGYF